MYNENSDYDTKKQLDRTEPRFDREKIMKAVTLLIEAIGDDPNREGLKGTPDRVARMYEEIFEGMNYTNDEIAQMFSTCFTNTSKGLVVEKNIPIFSYCEHHLALMYDMYVSIGYIPNGKVIGLSKMGRIADMIGKRLQLQERIGEDIAYIMQKVLNTNDVIVVIQGKHSCMTARGGKFREACTRTATLRGKFDTDSDLRQEFYSLIKD